MRALVLRLHRRYCRHRFVVLAWIGVIMCGILQVVLVAVAAR